MTQTTPSHSQAVEAAVGRLMILAWKLTHACEDDKSDADAFEAGKALQTALRAELATLTSQQEVAAPVGDAGERERKIDRCIAEAREMQRSGQYIRGWVFHLLADTVERLRKETAILVAELTQKVKPMEAETWAELHRLRAAVKAPSDSGFETWQDLAVSLKRKLLAASRVPVASLASREQGVGAVGAVPVAQEALEAACREKYPQWDNPSHFGEYAKALRRQEVAQEIATRTAPPSSKTQDDLAVADSGGVHAPEIVQLMKFYNADTLEAVVLAQNRQIEGLQARLPRDNTPMFQRVREG